MAELRIGVRVSLRGRAMKVLGVSATTAEPSRVFLEDEETGERFVITTRVLATEASGGPSGVRVR
jgi:hypothetical protein